MCKVFEDFFTGLRRVEQVFDEKNSSGDQAASFSMPRGWLLGLTFSSSLRMLGL
jgi:hypothetical protein